MTAVTSSYYLVTDTTNSTNALTVCGWDWDSLCTYWDKKRPKVRRAKPTVAVTASNSATYNINLTVPSVPEIAGGILKAGGRYELPDGAVLTIDALGNYTLDDKDAKRVYQACRVLEFNPFLNASDQLARFIEFVGRLGVRQQEVMQLPLELFVHWLVLEAAAADRDPVPTGIVPVPQHPQLKATVRPRCTCCRRFVPRARVAKGFNYCNARCAVRHAELVEAA